ncbi:CatA-like O-acetyltransferase [Haloimpatiens sp. FM7330]|uniref:CatA-like O-acetyltransferase n=1 Tax=Haloimpatiens sp. FM7330 TaxID=3298610 RepID=UPI0036350F22
MKFNIIDMNKWERREHFQHYDKGDNCSYSLTSNIDVTKLVCNVKQKKLKFYPVFIYIVTKAVNSMKEFRMALDKDGNLGFYDEVSASYTIFHEDDKTFSCAFTKYDSDFETFYKNITDDMEKYKDVKGFQIVKSEPNSFPVSCVPWLNYTGFNLNVPIDINFYAPIITWGKFVNNNGKLEMPLTVQINHAVADGYHTSMLFKEIQDICLFLGQ